MRPDTPEAGLALEQVFGDTGKDIDEMNERLKAAARQAGLPMGERKMTYNSRLAHELGKWAESKGKGDDFHRAVFRAYLVNGENIGKVSVLVDLAARLGLSRTRARQVIAARTFKQAVDLDWSRSLQVDPEYIPALMVNESLLINPQKYQLLERFMQENQIKKIA